MTTTLTEALLSQAAGWEAMKRARAYLEQGQVLSSHWAPPLLRGVVQAGDVSFRASLVIKNHVDMDNLCTCREAREWGKICAHVVAVGLHWLKRQEPAQPAGLPRASARASGVSNAGSATGGTGAILRHSEGEPAELCILLPPNLDQALARGRVMLVFEVRRRGNRCPLNALPRGSSFAFSDQDNAVLDWVLKRGRGAVPAMLQLDLEDLASLLPLLANHPRLTGGRDRPLAVSRTPLRLVVRASLESNGEVELTLREKPPGLRLLADWAWTGEGFQPLGLPPFATGLLQAPVRVPRWQVPLFLSQQWPQWQAAGGVEANFRLDDFVLEPQAPHFHLEVRGGLARLSALLQCAYGSRLMTVGVTPAEDSVWLPDPEDAKRYTTRDLAAERGALARLQRSGFTNPDVQGRLQLLGQSAVLTFFAREFPRLQREWTVTLEERLERDCTQNLERIEPRFEIRSSGVQWFDLGVVFASRDGETFSAAEIQRLLLSGQNHTRLKNGRYAVLDTGAVEELQEVLLDCAPQQHTGGYRIHHTQAGFLDATLRQQSGWRVEAPAAWRDRAARQRGEVRRECPPLGDLEHVLRPYQREGVAWLQFLRENGFGGILADEMGLGKTLQTLAFLRFVRQSQPGLGPVLVVCPTSLVFNWAAEARKFTPGLKVLVLHGPERHPRFADIRDSDLVLTSYALLRRDAERYRGFEFDTVVLDEAQHIKNRQTQNAQAVKTVRSRHRLVLTGTPLENSVLDLWSILDFLMPGYLGAAKDFRERYELPITRDRSLEVQARLARRLRPFLLRRLKRDVAADLPAKLEHVAYCELTAEQRAVYQQLLEHTRKEVIEAVGAQGLGRSRVIVLNALLRLRQVCCDLRLLKLEGVQSETASGKLDLFSELLEEVLDGGHRVLVFSQFVQMLALLKERLAAEDISFCYLDGSTTDRAAVVARFQQDATIPVFLISLKAGGVGLNLTSADTVIHFDPWWNPAVEDQATDRAHRIGQRRVVTSYKLITRETVEEKIQVLQGRKRELTQAMLGDEAAFTGALDWDEIQELLA